MVDESSTIKLPVFSGKDEDFPTWWRRFKAYGKVKKFSQCLKPEAETDLPASDTEAAGDTADEKKARSRNKTAMLSFTMAFKTDSMMKIIMGSETDEYPEGLAWKVVAELEQ